MTQETRINMKSGEGERIDSSPFLQAETHRGSIMTRTLRIVSVIMLLSHPIGQISLQIAIKSCRNHSSVAYVDL